MAGMDVSLERFPTKEWAWTCRLCGSMGMVPPQLDEEEVIRVVLRHECHPSWWRRLRRLLLPGWAQ